jgi:phosphonate transport system substrate-binding protein
MMGPRSGFSIRAALLILVLLAASPAMAEKIYSFGVVPQETASQLAANWAPILATLSEKSGLRVEFATAPDIPTFERRVAAGEYDFVYMNPYHFVVFNAKPGYHALARARGERVRGIVVVRKDSIYKDLRDLSGSTLAFPSPAAFAATLLVSAELRRHDIDFKVKIVKSHNSVYRDVVKGLYPAGGGVPRTFQLLDESISKQLRILWTSAEFTSHAIASRPDMEEVVRVRLLKAMGDMSEDAEARKQLARIGFNGFEPARDKDWDDVRRLGIRPADVLIEE